jgi:hypothetical protein
MPKKNKKNKVNPHLVCACLDSESTIDTKRKKVKYRELGRGYGHSDEKKTEKDSGLQKDSGLGEKRKGEKAKEGKESEKEIQRRWMQSPLSTTDGLEKGKNIRKKEIQRRWMQSPPSTTNGLEKGKNKRKKEIQMRWMQSPPSTTDGFEKGKASA